MISYDAIDCCGLDVVLCGHMHGGLILVMFIDRMVEPEQSRWRRSLCDISI